MNKSVILILAFLLAGFYSQAQTTFSFQDLQKWWKGNKSTATITDVTVGVRGTAITGTILNVGEEMKTNDTKYSANKAYFIIVQTDGHICIYQASNHGFVWGSGTNGKTQGGKLVMQTDGDLVFYGDQNQALWYSGTHGGQYNEAKYKATKLVLENDGTLALYSDTGYKVWTNTAGKLPLN